jgi:hypothetical protein
MLGNITSTTMEEYKEEHGKDLSQKTFTVRKFSSENSIGYLDKKSWDEIQSINQTLENDISNEQRISIKNYDGVFESNNLLKKGDFFKHNGNLYKIDDISLKDNHWKVIQLNVSEFNTNNYFKVIP